MRVGESFCPGILHAVPAKDGLLTRIRVPGGLILPSQLGAVAKLSAAFGNGQVEITSRANLQIRAIKSEDLPKVVQGLASAGFLPSSPHDRVRNITASPFAGLDAKELLDTRPLVRELDNRLVRDLFTTNLPPKFNFAISGGGDWFSRDIDDLGLRAILVGSTPLFHLIIGGILSGFGVSVGQAIDCLLETARMCLHISKEFDLPARGRKIALVPQAMSSLLGGLSHFLVPCPRPDDLNFVADMPVGVYSTNRVDLVSAVPSIPLGRMTTEQAHSLASIAQEWDGDLRLGPWRGIVLGSLPENSIDVVSAHLQAVGLSCDGKDGYRGIAACAGSAGCDASLADVRRDASLLAERLTGCDPQNGWSVNISGCEKQCAMRSGATVELVAGYSGYGLKIDGDSVASDCSLELALETAVLRRAGKVFRGVNL